MSRVQLDLLRIDRTIRPGHGLRASMKSGSAEAWILCSDSLAAVLIDLSDSVFADRNGSPATWIHWRKSGTSKQLLGLLRAAVEEAPGSALAALCVRERTLHYGIRATSFLFMHTQHGVLWPAMREWILDLGGLQAIWQALAWSMALVGEDKAAHDAALRMPVQAVIGITSRPDGIQPAVFPISVHTSVAAALTLLFSDLLPRDLASGNAHEWRIRELLGHVVSFCDLLGRSQPQPQLHRAFILTWPHLMACFRQSHPDTGTGMQQMGDVKNQMVRH